MVRIYFAATICLAGLAVATPAVSQTAAHPPEGAPSSGHLAGATYQGLPGVWVNQGNRLWFCYWQGNATPRNQQIACAVTELSTAGR